MLLGGKANPWFTVRTYSTSSLCQRKIGSYERLMATVALPGSSGSDGNQGSKYVIQFLWKYQDFWKAELDSVLALFNLNPSNIYNSEDLENITTPFIFATFSTVEDVKKYAPAAS